MTEKQRNFLLKFLPKDFIDTKTEFKDFGFTSSCIKFIMDTYNFGVFAFDIKVVKKHLTEKETDLVKHLKDHINSNKENYTGPNDEYYSLNSTYYIPESDKLFFVFRQTWYKGMSESSTSHYITVDETGKEVFYSTQYTELFRMNVNSLNKFFEYLKRNSFTPQI